MNSQELYVLNTLNELTTRLGLSPMTVIGDIGRRESSPWDVVSLEIEFAGPRDETTMASFRRLLSALGIEGQDWAIDAPIETIAQRVESALNLAPRVVYRK